MAECCNTCGAFEGVDKCDHCPTLICPRCKLRHEPFCKEIQKMKARGQGPTIANVSVPQHRAGHETPLTTGPDRSGFVFIPPSRGLLRVAESTPENGLTLLDIKTMVAALTTDAVPMSDVDQALDAVKDLLAE